MKIITVALLFVALGLLGVACFNSRNTDHPDGEASPAVIMRRQALEKTNTGASHKLSSGRIMVGKQ